MEGRMLFDLPKNDKEEITELRAAELALSEELKKKVRLPTEHIKYKSEAEKIVSDALKGSDNG